MLIRGLVISLIFSFSAMVQAELNSHPDYLAIKPGMTFQEVDNFVHANGLVYGAVSPKFLVIRDNETTYIPNIQIAVLFCDPLLFETNVQSITSLERFVNSEDSAYNSYKMIEKHRELLDLILSKDVIEIGSRVESENGRANGFKGNAIQYEFADHSTWELGIFRRSEENNFSLQLKRMDVSVCTPKAEGTSE